MKRWFAAALLLPVVAFAADKKPLAHYTLVPEQSKLKFVAIENSAPVEGAFKTFSADIYFSPDDLPNSKITAEVDMASVFAAYPAVGEELVKPDWFDVAHFPKATLRTNAIKMMPDRPNDDRHYYYADSDLTIRDKTVKVELEFTITHLDEKSAVADGRISLKRREFGVGQGKWQSADEVDDAVGVTLHAVAKRVNP